MAEHREEGPADLTAQVRRHLESLRAAGVDWLPASAALPERVAEAPPVAPKGGNANLPIGEAATGGEENANREIGVPGLFETEIAAAPAALPAEQRRLDLQMLAEQVAGCTRCKELAATRTQTVFGVGRLDPEVCFIGEAPGRDEDAVGEPFVGAAGQLLTRIIVAMGLKREEVYICNILRCRPPDNRPPTPDEAVNCREWLQKTLELVRPKYICALGASAVKHLTGAAQGITRMRGKWLDYQGVPVMCTFHPSYLLRDPTKKREVWEDMKALLARMGRPVPAK